LLHLQCHFGQDTLSWARLGARATGVDFSATAIKRANQLALLSGVEARFVESNLYDLPSVLHDKYDIVFTSYGVLGWLPDLDRWAEIVARYLKPGGIFYIVEFHPIIWMFDDDFQALIYPYDSRQVMEFEEDGTYADREAPVKGKSYSWNHGLSSVIEALISHGLSISFFREHLHSPYNIFPRPVSKEGGLWAIEGLDGMVPMLYSIKATANR
jgi:SAM-dependent methyltransferase